MLGSFDNIQVNNQERFRTKNGAAKVFNKAIS